MEPAGTPSALCAGAKPLVMTDQEEESSVVSPLQPSVSLSKVLDTSELAAIVE
jgi:hypothetical protein